MFGFLVNTQVQSHAMLRRGFDTSMPFIRTASDSIAAVKDGIHFVHLFLGLARALPLCNALLKLDLEEELSETQKARWGEIYVKLV